MNTSDNDNISGLREIIAELNRDRIALLGPLEAIVDAYFNEEFSNDCFVTNIGEFIYHAKIAIARARVRNVKP